MQMLPLLILVAGAALFYRAAEYERMSGWLWAIMSVGLSGIMIFIGTTTLMIAAQIGLFIVMWWYNAQRRMPR